MRTDNKIHVVNAVLKEEKKVYNLTKFQKWICKVFKIEPRCRYKQEFDLLLSFPYKEYGGGINDVLVFTDADDKWCVVQQHSRRVKVISITYRNTPRTELEFRGLEGIILSSSFQELRVR